MDFAKLVETMEAHGVTFVSVTQSFNTTTSMGRLTLNILLSFAQFEREVIGERIRNKFAASRARGMWMGGKVPLGYNARDRKLVVNQKEATTVRRVVLGLRRDRFGDKANQVLQAWVKRPDSRCPCSTKRRLPLAFLSTAQAVREALISIQAVCRNPHGICVHRGHHYSRGPKSAT